MPNPQVVDIRFVIEGTDPQTLMAEVINNLDFVWGAIILKNDGFGRLLPDASTMNAVVDPFPVSVETMLLDPSATEAR